MEFPSDTLLLSTKLKIPVLRKNYVVRRTLFEKLSQCADMSVIFIRGGAGTGKTTLLSSFIHETDLKDICWLSLDFSNNNVYSFWLYFSAAVNSFMEDGENFLDLMRFTPDTSHMENLLTMLINQLYGDQEFYIVLDDVHCIGDPTLIHTIEFFIGAMPPNFHIFMLSREDPPVYLGPLAMSGRLLFVDGEQMRLTAEEGMTFLKHTLRLSGSEKELSDLNKYADGWVGGLQLAAAAGAIGKHSGNLLCAGGGIATEYLTRELLESLTADERDFLIGTGFLSYFNAEICATLFDGFSKADFEKMINILVDKNLFIICIDEKNSVYRYHNILSDYLTNQFQRLPEEQKQDLRRKSAFAFEFQNDCEEALREFSEAKDYDNVLRVARSMGGRIEAWSYLDKVPLEILIKDADLAAQCFIYNIGNLNIDRCRELYEKFRKIYGNSDVFRAIQFAQSYISESNNILPEYHAVTAVQVEHMPFGSVTKAMILVQNSAAFVAYMQYEEAESCIKDAIIICAGANILVDLYAYNQLAQIYEETGRLNESLTCYEKSNGLLTSPLMLSGIGINYYIGLTGVYMRRMELDKAAASLDQARSLLEAQHIHVDVADMTLSYHEAEMQFLLGDDKAGTVYVEGILSEYPDFNVLTLGRLLHELDCANMLSEKLADEFMKEIKKSETYSAQPFMRLLRARLLFKKGKNEEALREIEEVLTFSRLHKNRLHLVEAGLLKVLMLIHSSVNTNSHREIINLLREAVHYAYENRILMPFYLDRRILLPLLIELSAQATCKNALSTLEAVFLRDIMTVCGHSEPAIKGPDLLSSRELEVLTELSLGLTNREIADKLCISQATVKTHVLSIFGKLGVSSRMIAVQEGRAKGLIQ